MEEKKSVLRQIYTLKAEDQALHAAGRLTVFIDGILAIAATLLVLDLQVDFDTSSNSLQHQIASQGANLVAIALGFLWIAGTWVLSHRQVRQLRGVDHYMSLYVLASTLVVTLIPFATKLLAAGYGHPDFWVGVEAVNVVILISTVLSVFSSRYAHHHQLLILTPPARSAGQRRPVALVIWYTIVTLCVVATVIAKMAPWVSIGIVVATRLSALMPLGSDRKGLPGDITENWETHTH